MKNYGYFALVSAFGSSIPPFVSGGGPTPHQCFPYNPAPALGSYYRGYPVGWRKEGSSATKLGCLLPPHTFHILQPCLCSSWSSSWTSTSSALRVQCRCPGWAGRRTSSPPALGVPPACPRSLRYVRRLLLSRPNLFGFDLVDGWCMSPSTVVYPSALGFSFNQTV